MHTCCALDLRCAEQGALGPSWRRAHTGSPGCSVLRCGQTTRRKALANMSRSRSSAAAAAAAAAMDPAFAEAAAIAEQADRAAASRPRRAAAAAAASAVAAQAQAQALPAQPAGADAKKTTTAADKRGAPATASTTATAARKATKKHGPAAPVVPPTEAELRLAEAQRAAAAAIRANDPYELQRLIRPEVTRYPREQWLGQRVAATATAAARARESSANAD